MRDPGKTRSIKDINRIFSYFPALTTIITDRLQDQGHADVLEVGFGWGRALMDLAWHFHKQPVSLYGVDIKQKPPVETPEDLRIIARDFSVIPQKHLNDCVLPSLFFYDATRLHFKEESLDCVYSVVTIRFMHDKLKFVEEVCRVLRRGGCALLHLGEANWNYPYSRISDQRVLTPFTARLVLLHEQELIPVPQFFQLFSGPTFDFLLTPNARCTLMIRKKQSGGIRFNAVLNESLTIPGRELPLRNRRGEIRSGIRTVYNLPTPLYRNLLNHGLIAPPQLQPALPLPTNLSIPTYS